MISYFLDFPIISIHKMLLTEATFLPYCKTLAQVHGARIVHTSMLYMEQIHKKEGNRGLNQRFAAQKPFRRRSLPEEACLLRPTSGNQE